MNFWGKIVEGFLHFAARGPHDKGDPAGASKKFWKLGAQKRKILVWTALGLTWARLEMRVIPFRRIAQSLTLGVEAKQAGWETPFNQLETLRWSISVLSARLPWCKNCLAQAVAAKRYLNQMGIPSTLFLGVATAAHQTGGNLESIEAHAWVECGGRVLTGESHIKFQILYSLS